MQSHDNVAPAETRFEQQVVAVLQALRREVAAVLAAVPGLDIASSATDVQRALRINSKLSWQVHKFATTPSPIDVACHLPKPAAMKRFCDAARRKAVPQNLISQVMLAVEDFSRLVEEHAGDRTTFDAMVGNLRGDATANQLHQQHRRDAFRAQSHIWGVQAKAMLSLMMLRGGAEPGAVDGVTIGGHVHLRRFRHDAKWILFGRCVASDKDTVGSDRVQPLFPKDNERFGAPLLGKFCNMTDASFRVLETDSHVRYIEATADAIGNQSAATYLSGEVWRNVHLTNDPGGTRSLLARARVRIPSEVLYHDVMLHRDLNVHAPQLLAYGDLRTGDDALGHDESERLPCFDTVTHLGRGAECVFAPEYPRYTELAVEAFEAIGWDANEFEVYRCRVTYPVLPSTLVMRFIAAD